MSAELISLPWQVQVALASGYAGYMAAYAGMRSDRQTVEITFLSLLFGLFATAILGLLSHRIGQVAAGLVGFFGAVAVGLAWRKWGRDFWWGMLRAFRVSHSNDDPNAIAVLGSKTHCVVTQCAVQLDDNSWLFCDYTGDFRGAVHAPVTIGTNADVALYVTSVKDPEGNLRRLADVRNAEYGDRLTYVPAARVRRLSLRYRPLARRPEEEAESAARP